ncbi:transposase [Candidatus Kaiserbacteria bacterium]|nr:transposase [Candidatus Kaiserbacteria bacterium]
MELYHVLNRGVDKRTIFLDDQDRHRFVHDLFIFNDSKPAENTEYFYSRTTKSVESIDLRGRYKDGYKPDKRKQIVDIHAWCLMGNHYHLLLSSRVDNGITKFLMKLNVGYAKYFNERYKRAGTLFQGRTKKVRIATDAHFMHIMNYIHLNPLDFLKGADQWRDLTVKNPPAALKHLENYRWSSFQDYSGRSNFPSIISTDLFGDEHRNYKKDIARYLEDVNIEPIKDLLHE